MPFDRQVLADDEEILVDTRLHWVPLVGPVLLTALAAGAAVAISVGLPGAPLAVGWVLVAMVGLPFVWLVGRVLRWRSVRLVVTAGRLVYRKGVLGRDVAQLRLQRVAEVHCTQSLGGRLIGSGRLVLEIAGGEAVVIDHVRQPRSLQRVIAGQLDGAWYAGYAGYAGQADGRPATWSGDLGQGATIRSSRPPGPPLRPWGPEPAALGATDTPPNGVPTSLSLAADVAASPASAAATSGTSVPDQLIRLDELRRRGIITVEEFEAKKVELLRRL